jgi:AcrR family transcriptional regulator
VAEQLTTRAREIVEAARSILEEQGEQALVMRAVAQKLGIRAPSLYKHLPDKAALEAAILSAGFAELAEVFEAAVVGGDEPFPALAVAYRDWANAHPHLYRLMFDRPLPRDRLTPGVEQRAAAAVIQAAGGDRDLARAAFAFAHGMVILELNNRFPPDADLDSAWTVALDAFTTARRR